MRIPAPEEEVALCVTKFVGYPFPQHWARPLIDVGYVTKNWEKLSARLGDDPDGAITAARTLLETVCLHILSMLGKGTEYKGLPALYKATAEELQLVPKKEEDAAIRQILGSIVRFAEAIEAL